MRERESHGGRETGTEKCIVKERETKIDTQKHRLKQRDS